MDVSKFNTIMIVQIITIFYGLIPLIYYLSELEVLIHLYYLGLTFLTIFESNSLFVLIFPIIILSVPTFLLGVYGNTARELEYQKPYFSLLTIIVILGIISPSLRYNLLINGITTALFIYLQFESLLFLSLYVLFLNYARRFSDIPNLRIRAFSLPMLYFLNMIISLFTSRFVFNVANDNREIMYNIMIIQSISIVVSAIVLIDLLKGIIIYLENLRPMRPEISRADDKGIRTL